MQLLAGLLLVLVALLVIVGAFLGWTEAAIVAAMWSAALVLGVLAAGARRLVSTAPAVRRLGAAARPTRVEEDWAELE